MSTGSPPRMVRLRFPTVRWSTLLLLASVGCTALGFVEASRAIRSQHEIVAQALNEYASFGAWSYQEHLRVAVGSMTQEVLGPMNHGDNRHIDPRVPPASQLGEPLPWSSGCGCLRPRNGPIPDHFFAFTLEGGPLDVARNRAVTDPHGSASEPQPTRDDAADAQRWIADTLRREIRAHQRTGRFPLVVASHLGAPRIVAYTLMPTAWGDTIVYGADYSRDAFAGLLAGVMDDRGVLPASFTRGRAVRDVMLLQVTSAEGDVLFESEPKHSWSLDQTTSPPPELGALRVRAQIRPSLAGVLIIGGLPRSRLPFLFGLLAVSTALALVAVGQVRRASELARMRGDFVNSISHELRTPLAQIRLYLETLRLGRFKTEEQRRWSLDNVERETARLTYLVERVLRFSHVGRSLDATAASVLVDATSEVTRIVDEFRPLATGRRSDIVLQTETTAAIRTTGDALRHVVINLLDNAIRYGPIGQTVRVRVDELGPDVRIAVTDEGPGVPRADCQLIWQPYQRGRGMTHTSGSGIGLAIVRDVMEQHGGRAWLAPSAANDAGATFMVCFPIAVRDTDDVRERTPRCVGLHVPDDGEVA